MSRELIPEGLSGGLADLEDRSDYWDALRTVLSVNMTGSSASLMRRFHAAMSSCTILAS
ncbi:hypothetical protein K503DRAFT_778115 [Rhizopogon vinicolor AM-OR11-026]|uniref:Uncharacterized protein n=1 Tax=Rhizopogon vinicolor AM-OR11-026 TaxID=1314800 RepID=A0A1B7MDB7_9AGAM|nr:hypothetical protein K503DRAFT_778115 [Rhizopogon vinicolor AM-OR11-026]